MEKWQHMWLLSSSDGSDVNTTNLMQEVFEFWGWWMDFYQSQRMEYEKINEHPIEAS